jgi:hypothetical protein
MNPNRAKLQLNRETIRLLSASELDSIHGGAAQGPGPTVQSDGDATPIIRRTLSYLFCTTTISLLMTCEPHEQE